MSLRQSRFLLLRKLPHSHYVLLAALFVVGLELLFLIHHWLYTLVTVFLVIIAAGIALLRWEEKHRFAFSQTILPVITAASLGGFALFIPLTVLIHLYFVLAGLIFFLVLRYGARVPYPTWNWALTTLVFFLATASLVGWRFYAYAPLLVILILLFVVYGLLSWQAFLYNMTSVGSAWLLATAHSLALVQLAWVVQFLPLSPLALSGLITTFYYASFHLLSTSIDRRLRTQDVLEYGTVSAIACVIISLTSKWL